MPADTLAPDVTRASVVIVLTREDSYDSYFLFRKFHQPPSHQYCGMIWYANTNSFCFKTIQNMKYPEVNSLSVSPIRVQDLNLIVTVLERRHETLRVNSLWTTVTKWRHRSQSTLAQVMAWCRQAPCHYLNQCWYFINEVQCHSSESDFTASGQATILYNEFENHTFNITATSPMEPWVNTGVDQVCFTNDFPSKFKFDRNLILLHFHSWPSDVYNFHIPWQHSCHGMSKIL